MEGIGVGLVELQDFPKGNAIRVEKNYPPVAGSERCFSLPMLGVYILHRYKRFVLFFFKGFAFFFFVRFCIVIDVLFFV